MLRSDRLRSEAARAACERAEELGLRFDQAVLLGQHSNLSVWLAPTPVVARIATIPSALRPGAGWFSRELSVAGHLARAGAPVVAPSRELSPGPHQHSGWVVSFWQHVPPAGAIDPAAAGRALRACHEALQDFNGDLIELGPTAEAERIVAWLAAREALAADDVAVLERAAQKVRSALERTRLPLQAVHGDAHLSNVIQSSNGPLWTDWEDTFLGPRHWDFACLIASARLSGDSEAPGWAALAACASEISDAELEPYVEARALQLAIWTAVAAHELGRDREGARARIDWFRARELRE
jgi:hypothetical protein